MQLFGLLGILPALLFTSTLNPLSDQLSEQAPLRGIYLTAPNIASQTGMSILDEWKKKGGNMVVFDVQSGGGRLAYPSAIPLSKELGNFNTEMPNLADIVQKIHAKGIHATARYVLIKNPFLIGKKPAWALKNPSGSGVYANRDGAAWIDPGNPEFQSYVTDIVRELAAAGVDEIQFDYIRFPDGPKPGQRLYSYTGEKEFTRDQTITNFLAMVSPEIHAMGAQVSADVFGIVVWDNVTWKLIGQNVHEMAKHLDAIYPMPYPSHFGAGWGGHENPADEPYFFVQETTKKFIEQAYPSAAEIRPWLQGFAMNVTNYSPQYVQDQVRGLSDLGAGEYVIWNASNNYEMSFAGFKK